jgi:hypothetical protein
MKVITEFPGFLLSNALKAKNALVAEGKAIEEIEASLGATFKAEGEKLKHFLKSLEVVGNVEGVRRVIVMTIAEGENAPARSTKVEEFYYVSDVPVLTGSKPGDKPAPKGKGGGKRDKKESPWGLSPEEKAAKNAKKGTTGKPA